MQLIRIENNTRTARPFLRKEATAMTVLEVIGLLDLLAVVVLGTINIMIASKK
jgi:hypothetical protein